MIKSHAHLRHGGFAVSRDDELRLRTLQTSECVEGEVGTDGGEEEAV